MGFLCVYVCVWLLLSVREFVCDCVFVILFSYVFQYVRVCLGALVKVRVRCLYVIVQCAYVRVFVFSYIMVYLCLSVCLSE